MNLITVEVINPVLSATYDFRLPDTMKISDIKRVLVDDIRAFEDIASLFGDGVELFSETGVLEDEYSLLESNIRNGDRIMIVGTAFHS